MQPTSPQQPQPPVVQPQPQPETWRVTVISNGIAVEIFHPGGVHVSFLTADDAIRIGRQIADGGRQANTGLIQVTALPPDMPTLGNGHGG